MRRFLFIIVVGLIAVIYFYNSETDSNHATKNGLIHRTRSVFNNIAKMVSKVSPVTEKVVSATVNQAATDFADIVDLGTLNSNSLNNWILEQSNSLDSTSVDTTEVELKTKALARTLKFEQLSQFTDMIKNVKLPANARIFASYVLSLTELPESAELMADTAAQPLTDFGPPVPHSESELRRTQELALRYMQVDALFERAKTDPNALNKLNLLSKSAESEEVRQYVLKKLKSSN